MKTMLSIIPGAFLMVLIIVTNCTAQSKKVNTKEVFDFVVPRTLSKNYEPVITQEIKVDKYWNAFNYPADSTLYYLNGKQAKSQKAAKKELDERSVTIERVSIGAVGRMGKREVEIDYQVKPKN